MLAQVYEQRILGLFEKQSPGLKKAWSEGYKDPEEREELFYSGATEEPRKLDPRP